MRRVLITVLVSAMFAACGGAAAVPSASPTSIPTSIPTLEPTASPSLSAAPSPSSPTTAPSPAGAFLVAGVTSSLDPNANAPDPSAFGTSFTSDSAAIYVAFQLAPGLSGKVTSTWKESGATDVVATFDYPASAPWAYFRLTHPGGFVPGDNQEILAFGPTSESVTLDFTVTGAAATPSAAPSGSGAFTLLRMATSVDRSKNQPDPSTYTDSFSTSASTVYVVFELRSGLTGTVTLAMTRGGSAVIKPVSLDITTVNGWNDFHVNSASGFPSGDYAATVTFEPTGESQTVTFTVQ
jgi:hypothetical protein